MKFQLGKTVATANVARTINPFDINKAITRHVNGDWGDLDDDDKASNDEALKTGEDRIFSVYQDSNGIKFWIITEWDRSYTTVLLPSDY